MVAFHAPNEAPPPPPALSAVRVIHVASLPGPLSLLAKCENCGGPNSRSAAQCAWCRQGIPSGAIPLRLGLRLPPHPRVTRDPVSHPHYESPTVEDIDDMERRNGHRDYVMCLTAWCRALMYERDAALKTIEPQERHEPQDSTR